MANVINWFEIPVVDLARAKTFYGKVLDTTFQDMPDSPGTSFFAFDGPGVGGHLQAGEGTPSDHGPLLYLDAKDGVKHALSLAETSGGKVLLPSTSIGPHGFVGIVLDTEGNRVGLHSVTE